MTDQRSVERGRLQREVQWALREVTSGFLRGLGALLLGLLVALSGLAIASLAGVTIDVRWFYILGGSVALVVVVALIVVLRRLEEAAILPPAPKPVLTTAGGAVGRLAPKPKPTPPPTLVEVALNALGTYEVNPGEFEEVQLDIESGFTLLGTLTEIKNQGFDYLIVNEDGLVAFRNGRNPKKLARGSGRPAYKVNVKIPDGGPWTLILDAYGKVNPRGITVALRKVR